MSESEPVERWTALRPVRVFPRPRAVWWAYVPGGNRFGTAGRQCTDQAHPVYLGRRPRDEHQPGCQGNDKQREFYVCAVCSPPAAQPDGETETTHTTHTTTPQPEEATTA